MIVRGKKNDPTELLTFSVSFHFKLVKLVLKVDDSVSNFDDIDKNLLDIVIDYF